MASRQTIRRGVVPYACVGLALVLRAGSGVLAIQAPQEVPVTHERQCVSTGEIPSGDARTITVTWKHPFATNEYGIIGSVSEAGDKRQAIEMGHIVIPHTATTAAAVVFNLSDDGPQSGILCLDASTE